MHISVNLDSHSGNIRTGNRKYLDSMSAASGQQIGNTWTACRQHPDSISEYLDTSFEFVVLFN